MVSLTLSAPLTHHSPSAICRPHFPQTPPPPAVFLHTPKRPSPPLKCSVSSFHHQTPTSSSSPDSLLRQFSASSPQDTSTAMRGALGDVMGLLLKERIVFLGCDIDDFVADAIIGQLLLLDAQDPKKDIRLFINSTGGSMSATMAIFDVLRLVRADVSTIALGTASSTASLILLGGTKGKRLSMPNARIMIHQPLGGISGKVLDVEIQAKEVMNSKTTMTRIMSEITGRSFKQVEEDIDKDRYMSPMEAVEYGIIDGVIDEGSIVPLITLPESAEARFTYEDLQDMEKVVTPKIPDDEIY